MAGREWMKGLRAAATKRAGDVAAELTTRALDAMQKVDGVRSAPKKVTAAAKARLGTVAGKAMDVAERVPVAGKVAGTARRMVEDRLGRGKTEPAKRRPGSRAAAATGEGRDTARSAGRSAVSSTRAKVAPVEDAREETEHLPEPTDPELRLDTGSARVTTTSRGRKTVPLAVAAARKARAQRQQDTGFKPKKGQKKKTRH